MSDYVTLYMDDAGDSQWTHPRGNSTVKNHTIGGIILSPEQDMTVRAEINALLRKHISHDA